MKKFILFRKDMSEDDFEVKLQSGVTEENPNSNGGTQTLAS